MDLIANLALGFSVAFSPENLFYCLVGCFLGTAIGVLPGIGPLTTMALLLPITFSLPATSSLIMLSGIYYGAQYGGSTTSILMNLPGEASSSVTTIDGFQMTKQGRAGPALATAALVSFFAGCVSTLFVAAFAAPLTIVVLKFGPTEYFAMIILGLIIAVTLARGSILKALAMVVMGVLFGLVGTDIYTAQMRFTLGFIELSDGIELATVAIGMFGVAEILRNLEDESDARPTVLAKVTNLWLTKDDFKRVWKPALRGTLIGSVLGVLPGAGAALASFTAYSVEKKLSRTPQIFGKGAIEGVAAPESANNASAQTHFIPLLTLGLPSGGVMALLLGAMMIQGVVPGPRVITNNPDLFWGLIASMWIGNAMLVILNLPLVGLWVRLLKIPYYVLFPLIIVFSSIGIYSIENSPFDLYLVAVFGLFGYFLAKLDFEPAPFLLGLVLGPMLEEQFRRAMIFSAGDPSTFFTHPISLGLLLVAAAALILVSLPTVLQKREEVFVED